jgi:hypothetical protein
MVREHRLPLARICAELPRFERLRTGDLLELSLRMRWGKLNDDGVAVVTPQGDLLLEMPTEASRLRRALIDYVEIERPQWTALVLDGRARFMSFAPVEFRQSVSEAYLAEGYEPDVVAFWDMLAAIARGRRSAVMSRIGRIGERLTLAYEKIRTGRDPVWHSIESNSDGFDVMSVVSSDNHSRLPIEVKASTQGRRGLAHLTRNEWEQAGLMGNHALYLWDISSEKELWLAVVSRAEIAAHIPGDRGSGEWKEAEIPFLVFATSFKPVEKLIVPEFSDDSGLH